MLGHQQKALFRLVRAISLNGALILSPGYLIMKSCCKEKVVVHKLESKSTTIIKSRLLSNVNILVMFIIRHLSIDIRYGLLSKVF